VHAGLGALDLFEALKSERYRRKLMEQASGEMRTALTGHKEKAKRFADLYTREEDKRRDIAETLGPELKQLREKDEIAALGGMGPQVPVPKPDPSTIRQQQPQIEGRGLPQYGWQEHLTGAQQMEEILQPIETPWDAHIRMLETQIPGALVDPAQVAHTMGQYEYQQQGRLNELERLTKIAMDNEVRDERKYWMEQKLLQAKHGHKKAELELKDYFRQNPGSIVTSRGGSYVYGDDPSQPVFQPGPTYAGSGKVGLADEPVKAMHKAVLDLAKQIDNLKSKGAAPPNAAGGLLALLQGLIQQAFQDEKYQEIWPSLMLVVDTYGLNISPPGAAPDPLAGVVDPNSPYWQWVQEQQQTPGGIE
jgi:hypothetical protein